MSENFYEKRGVILTRYAGPVGIGRMLQVTVTNPGYEGDSHFVAMTWAAALDCARAILKEDGRLSSAIVSERTAAAESTSVETTTRVVRNDDTASAPD